MVPDSFTTPQEYGEVFLPLFLMETRAQLHRSRQVERGPTESVSFDIHDLM